MSRHDWVQVAAEWREEVAALEKSEGTDSRAYRGATQNLRSAERRVAKLRAAEERGTRFDSMPLSQAARVIVDESER